MTIDHDYGGEMHQEPVTKSQFKAKALEYFRKVESTGEPIIVTDRGKPAVEIRRCPVDERSPLERLKGSVLEFVDPFAPVSDDDWDALS